MKIIFIQLIFGRIENKIFEKFICRAHLFYKDSITYNTKNGIMGSPQHKCQFLLFAQSVDGVIYKAVVMKDGS